MKCKVCGEPIQQMIEGEPICNYHWILGQMTPEEIEWDNEIAIYEAERKREQEFKHKLQLRLGSSWVQVDDNTVRCFPDIEVEIIHWYEPLDLMVDEWGAALRHMEELALERIGEDLPDKLGDLCRDFECSEAELFNALIKMAFTGEIKPSLITAKLNDERSPYRKQKAHA